MPRTGSSITHPRLVDVLTEWRRRGLPDTCTIHEPSSAAPTINATTKVLTPAAATKIYDGATLLSAAPAADRQVVAGDEVTVVRRYYASIDAAALTDTVPPGAIYTLTASDSTGLVGRAFTVVDVIYDSISTRQLLVLQDQMPAENGQGT